MTAPRRHVTISPEQRYALVGKTGSGKTTFGTALACQLVPADAQDWQIWWIDTKGEGTDLNRLRSWGFDRPAAPSRHVLQLRPENGDIIDQAQDLCHQAMKRGQVLVVLDEYTQVVVSNRTIGNGIRDVAARGRGMGVGLIGHTQEPVAIPRQLISMASHVFLFDTSYPKDVAYCRDILPSYERPLDRGDPHGFFHVAVDADGRASYYPHAKAWLDTFSGHHKERST